jgi:hypothetical protein
MTEIIIACIKSSQGECCRFFKCPLLKDCFPIYYEKHKEQNELQNMQIQQLENNTESR